MGDLQTRPFSKNYSGLINQSVIAVAISTICLTAHEVMRRRRRGKGKTHPEPGLGSRETWEFGYLYQARSWARIPTPPSPVGWPLAWVREVVKFPESEMNRLRGIDATLYVRFLRGCFWFVLLHTFTTFPILLPIHVHFSDDSVSPLSMTRASISSLVMTTQGKRLLWIHIVLLYWITISWLCTLLWICNGTFRLRKANIKARAERSLQSSSQQYFPHPHSQLGFADVGAPDNLSDGLRLRTVIVTNVPPLLRNEKELKEYFEYYMTKELSVPAVGLVSSSTPGFFNKTFSFLFNRAKKLPAQLASSDTADSNKADIYVAAPNVERVVVVRKMTELASLLERREEILRSLETAHIKLAKKTLLAVRDAMLRKAANKPLIPQNTSRAAAVVQQQRRSVVDNSEARMAEQDEACTDEQRMEQLISVLGPFVRQFGLLSATPGLGPRLSGAFDRLRGKRGDSTDSEGYPPEYVSDDNTNSTKTVWDALLELTRDSLDAYQPLINLSHLFRGKIVPSIDYYTAKLNLITSLVTESRAKSVSDYQPVSTAFVTFEHPEDAFKACKYLAVHPNNPLLCLVAMAPAYDDIDWLRMMKSGYGVEFVKDWVINIGVWAFTLFWLFPLSLLVGLVSIQNISTFWPQLQAYLDKHQWQEEIIQSFLPTLLVALLTLLIPLILLLIAKKAQRLSTQSAMHGILMSRYYKFLIVNVLVFFCVGTAALQSVLESFKSDADTKANVLEIVADSFPTAGPFYVGWLIFTTAMHVGFEIALLGLPLILYPKTRSQVTPRQRAQGIQPRTLNFYYWLPNHLLVLHVVLLFAVLNPVVIPFGAIYYFVQAGVIKNQLLHVYSKDYELNGQVLMIRMVRYSLDGRLTRLIRFQFQVDDELEASVLCVEQAAEGSESSHQQCDDRALMAPSRRSRPTSMRTWRRLPSWLNFTASEHRRRPLRRPPIPFTRSEVEGGFTRLPSCAPTIQLLHDEVQIGSSVDLVSPDSRVAAISLCSDPLQISTDPPDGGDDLQKPVVSHEPIKPWDDQYTVDMMYDNPFYTRAISNALWLPRDPFGVLDLDDTVDVHRSLTVEVLAGQLGTWFGASSSVVPSPEPLASSPEPADSPRLHPSTSPASMSIRTAGRSHIQYDGSEEIDLPPTISRRVTSHEMDVEHAAPVTKSSFSKRMRKVSFGERYRRRKTGDRLYPPGFPFRSFSDNQQTVRRVRSASQLPSLHSSSFLTRIRSTDLELGFRRDPAGHAPSDTLHTSASEISIPLSHHLVRAVNISSHQAILNEVLAEEETALLNRRLDEVAETEAVRLQPKKSWITSWLYNKPNVSTTSPPPTDNSAPSAP
ncbi:DUF221-domain-containing protein [Fistulina hepatica ATCC 64428]|uniref:DUF221-domain-containing protein n=1 Tax=Fistulina hepatica ATCC 64428 TaxID=1128425 RepID=A0A0D7A144_9AGAR|nr:DUF221-domain-containing protein [Fistulina hepatica ATCC 64428]